MTTNKSIPFPNGSTINFKGSANNKFKSLEDDVYEKQKEMALREFYQWLEADARDRLNKMQAVVDAARELLDAETKRAVDYGEAKDRLRFALAALDAQSKES